MNNIPGYFHTLWLLKYRFLGSIFINHAVSRVTDECFSHCAEQLAEGTNNRNWHFRHLRQLSSDWLPLASITFTQEVGRTDAVMTTLRILLSLMSYRIKKNS